MPGPGSRGGRAATGGGGAAELEAVRPLVQTISTLDTGSQVSTSQSQHGSKWSLDLTDAYQPYFCNNIITLYHQVGSQDSVFSGGPGLVSTMESQVREWPHLIVSYYCCQPVVVAHRVEIALDMGVDH